MKYIESVQTVIKNNTTAKILYVSQDIGNDINDGSFARPFKTIQVGINAAQTIAAYYNQVIIKVTPSSTGNGYNENITISQQGIVLEAEPPTYRSDAAIIKGTVTINLTGTSGGANFVAGSNIVYIKGFVIYTSSGDTITFSGSTFQRLFLSDCYVDNTGTGSALVLTNTGVSGAVKSTITCRNSDINNNSASNATVKVSAGRLFASGTTYDIQNGNSSGASVLIDGAAATACTAILDKATITGQVQITDNLSILYLTYASIASGSSAAITTPSSPNTGFIFLGQVGLTTTATNSITGSGVVVLAAVAKLSTGGDITSTVTQVVINGFPQGATLIGATATQTNNTLLTLKNGHIKTQQTTAPTVATNANAGTGASSALTNATDIAGNLQLITGNLSTTAAGIQNTVTFNKAYNVAPIVIITPTNAAAATNAAITGIYVTSTTTTFSINFVNAGLNNTTFQWAYQIIETQ